MRFKADIGENDIAAGLGGLGESGFPDLARAYD
jgi:hypothetical protein